MLQMVSADLIVRPRTSYRTARRIKCRLVVVSRVAATTAASLPENRAAICEESAARPEEGGPASNAPDDAWIYVLVADGG